MYHGQLLFRDHGQTPLPQHCQPWSNVVGNEKQWYHGHPVAGALAKVNEMMICPKHRHALGKYWKQRRPCQYPMHRGGRKATKSRNVVSVNMAKEIIKLHGVIVPIGSGLYMITCTSIYFRIPMKF